MRDTENSQKLVNIFLPEKGKGSRDHSVCRDLGGRQAGEEGAECSLLACVGEGRAREEEGHLAMPKYTVIFEKYNFPLHLGYSKVLRHHKVSSKISTPY